MTVFLVTNKLYDALNYLNLSNKAFANNFVIIIQLGICQKICVHYFIYGYPRSHVKCA